MRPEAVTPPPQKEWCPANMAAVFGLFMGSVAICNVSSLQVLRWFFASSLPNGDQERCRRRFCGIWRSGGAQCGTVFQICSRLGRHLADFGRHLGPSWVPKRVPKSHFWRKVRPKIEKMTPENDARKNIKFKLIFEPKMGGPDG